MNNQHSNSRHSNNRYGNNQKRSTLHRERYCRDFCFLTPLLFLTGCVSALNMPQVDFSTLKPPGPVVTVVAAWEPAVSNGENPMRGFGGRVYLYDQEMSRPVKAKGMLVVYIFDEEGRLPGDEKPNEGLVFDDKTLDSKGIYKKSKMGHSYNLWVPVDAAGPDGPAKKVSLIVRYIPEKGSSVVSSQATAHLPGRRSDGTMVAAHPEWQIQQESGQIQQVSAQRNPSERPVPQRRQMLPEVRMIEPNIDRPTTLQAVTIR